MQKVFATVPISSPSLGEVICSKFGYLLFQASARSQRTPPWALRCSPRLVARAGGSLPGLQHPALLVASVLPWANSCCGLSGDAESPLKPALPCQTQQEDGFPHTRSTQDAYGPSTMQEESLFKDVILVLFLTWPGIGIHLAVKINTIEDFLFLPHCFLKKHSVWEEKYLKKEKQLMGSLRKDVAGKFSHQAWKFWLNLAKSFQTLDSVSRFAAREPPSFSADSTVLCNSPISIPRCEYRLRLL